MTQTIDAGYPSECGSIVSIAGGKPDMVSMGARNVSIGMIGGIFSNNPKLAGEIDRPVIDGTGLTGNFDFRIDFAPEILARQSQTDQAAPTLLEALKDQLGLKLEPRTAPIESIVVDHIEEPSPN